MEGSQQPEHQTLFMHETTIAAASKARLWGGGGEDQVGLRRNEKEEEFNHSKESIKLCSIYVHYILWILVYTNILG